jgi:site-specific recombinase XerD
MFDQLFKKPETLARHRAAPLLEERLAFLAHQAGRGVCPIVLQGIARDLILVATALDLVSRSGEVITRDEIKRKAPGKRKRSLATRWLRFLGRLQVQPIAVNPYADQLKAFAGFMNLERGLSPSTIRGRCWYVRQFLNRLGHVGRSLRKLTPHHVDETLQEMLNQGAYARVTIRDWADALRAFFRYAETRDWCRTGLAASIRGPRMFTQASLPLGPSWDEVRRLLAMTESNRPVDIRDRAILMLLAVYGLRAGEVRRLRLDDVNWERELLTVVSSKSQRPRTYPLIRSVGDAILRYLREVRPPSPQRELFLTLRAPFQPLWNALWKLVARRLRSLDVSIPHYGPHALRHSCATHLLAEGLSLKEIGDHLGHVDPDTTRIYAKVDINGLRQVAEFDLGGLQ